MGRGLWVLFLAAVASAAALAASRVVAAPVLSLTAAVEPALAPAGSAVTYTITATNPGLEDVEGLAIRHVLPPGFAYVSGSASVSLGGAPLAASEPALIGRTVTWNRLRLPGLHGGSVFGMHTLIQDRCDNSYIDFQLDHVLEVAGPGAYVTQLLYPITEQSSGPQPCWVYFVNGAYDRGLTPILRLGGQWTSSYWLKPLPDSSGHYTGTAEAARRVVAGLPRREGRFLFVEVWNEPNLDIEWSGKANPSEYGHFLVDVAAAIRSLGDPRIVILNAALAPGGNYNNLDYIDALAGVPGALQSFDVWASHSYPANHPPQYNIHDGTASYRDMTIDSYLLELQRLAAHGRQGPRVLVTETGYALGDGTYGFEGYPAIDEQSRADYVSRAFRDYWSRWPELLGVCPFELGDPFGTWQHWDWLYLDGTHHPQYDAVRDLPKPAAVTAPGVLTITFRAVATLPGAALTSDVAAYAGGVALAAAPGVAPVTVGPLPPTPIPTATPVPTPGPAPTATLCPACRELLRNGGFEATAAWRMLGDPPGAYSSGQAHTGARSLRLGLAAGDGQRYSFSSARQQLTLPAGTGTASLGLWYRAVTSDTIGDRFQVLVQGSGPATRTLGYLDLAASTWTSVTLDTSGYLGQPLVLQLTAVNDGYAGKTTVYVDDVAWTVCLARDRHFLHLPLVAGLRASTGSRAPSIPAAAPPLTATPVASVSTAEAATARPSSAYRALAVDPLSGQVYAAAGDGVWACDPAGLRPPRRLLSGSGYQALLVDALARRLLVSDWAGGALLAFDLASGRTVARALQLRRPSGIALYGDRIFVAETGADRVVTLDRRTCGIIRGTPVDAGPYALAVDRQAARVWVASAGGDSVTALDARTGISLGTVQLGGLGHPQGIAVDERRGRVYVTYLLSPRYHALAVIRSGSLQIERVLQGDGAQPLTGACAVAVEPRSGRIWLAELAGIRVLDPLSLRALAALPGEGTVSPFGLAVDTAGGRVLAADGVSPAFRVLSGR